MGWTRKKRLEALEQTRLYFVCEADPRGAGDDPAEQILTEVVLAGCGAIQLRDKTLEAEQIPAAAEPFRAAARQRGLFVLNDRPDLAAACGADGVHVGQDDLGVAEARALAGAEALVGLSTHDPSQLEAACAAEGEERPDYISVGPVWATPTKPGRPATGLDYVAHAAEHATLPWFAIGGIDETNIGEVIAAGARRAVVVRAIRDAEDPADATRRLRSALDDAGVERSPVGGGTR